MNVTAIASMENFAKSVLTLSQEAQDEFFTKLEENLTFEEIETLKKCVSVYKLMTNATFYNAMKKAVGEQLYEEFNNQ